MMADFKYAALAAALALGALSAPAWAQTSGAGKINYASVPNLQPMKEETAAPDFTLGDPGGKRLSLKDFRGKVVLLNFWASWCVPCREEMPALQRLHQEFSAKGFVVVAVNVKDDREEAAALVKQLKLSYPILLDPEGEVGLLYGAWGLPTTYIIGRKGRSLARMWGPAEWYGPGARQLVGDLVKEQR